MTPDSHGALRTGAVLTIDLGAVAANWRYLTKRLNRNCALGAVVKANAYGLGVAQIAPTLAQAGCRYFFVADLAEGAELRRLLPDESIFVFNGPIGPDGTNRAADLVAHRLTPVLNDRRQIDIWRRQAAKSGTLDAIVHVDTGMNRLGLDPKNLPNGQERDSLFAGLRPRYIMSHLACADTPDHPLNEMQRADLIKTGETLGISQLSLANSSGLFLGKPYHFDLARAGGALYGLNPTPDKPNPMRCVATLSAQIIQLRSISPPGSIGYGGSFKVKQLKQIATLAVGYADGYPRSLSNRGSAVAAGRRVPIVGRVSMDYITLDVSDIPAGELSVGDPVQLIGPQHGADELAEEAGTIGYEILTNLGPRYRRFYLPDSSKKS